MHLGTHYASAGFSVAVGELPDYLPLMLEFASVAPAVGESLLREASPVLKTLHEAMLERRCSYECFIAALLDVLSTTAQSSAEARLDVTAEAETSVPLDVSVTDMSLTDMSEMDLESLDRQWQEEPVTFGLGAAHDDCRPVPPRLVPLRRSREETSGAH